MQVGLRIKKQFTQGKSSYLPTASATGENAFVPDEQWKAWEAITLANRLKNEFVAWEPLPEAGVSVIDEPVVADLDKAGLLLFAEDRFGAKLDGRSSEKTLREQIGSMQDRARLLATQDARGKALQIARSGGSAATVGAKGSATPPKAPAKPIEAPPAPPAGGDEPLADTGDTGTGTDDKTGAGESPAT